MSRIRGTARACQRSLRNVIDLSGQYVQTIDRAHEIPTLPAIGFFLGTRDPVIPIHHGTRLLDRFMGVTLTAYPDCGHFPHLEVPFAFASELRGFLAEPDQSRAFLLPRPHEEGRLRTMRVLAARTSK